MSGPTITRTCRGCAERCTDEDQGGWGDPTCGDYEYHIANMAVAECRVAREQKGRFVLQRECEMKSTNVKLDECRKCGYHFRYP